MSGEPILVYGDGLQLRDFNYVDDVVDALLITALDPRADGQVYNLGSSELAISLIDLAQLVVKIAGEGEYRLIPFPPDRKAIDIGDYYADFSKIRRELGWTPRVPMATGLTPRSSSTAVICRSISTVSNNHLIVNRGGSMRKVTSLQLPLRRVVPLAIIVVGLIVTSALVIQQVSAQASRTLKPPFKLIQTDKTGPRLSLPPLPLNAPVLISETFGTGFNPSPTLTGNGWHGCIPSIGNLQGYSWGASSTAA